MRTSFLRPFTLALLGCACVEWTRMPSAMMSVGHHVRYDPLANAIQLLADMGAPPPRGYTISSAAPGELSETSVGHTDNGALTIQIDLQHVADMSSPLSALEYTVATAIVLLHEYGHTINTGYDTPGLSSSDLKTKVCGHALLWHQTMSEYCDFIAFVSSAGESVTGLCDAMAQSAQQQYEPLAAFAAINNCYNPALPSWMPSCKECQ